MSLYLYDNDFVKFEHDGKRLCLHVHNDDTPDDPRSWVTPITTMACFLRRYKLGDDIGTSDPDEFWQGLVATFVPDTELIQAVQDGKASGMKLEPSDDPDCVTLCVLSYWATPSSSSERDWTYDPVDKDPRWLADAIRENLSIGNCQSLLEPYLEWLPLWVYEHGGITMSCGDRSYPYNDRWDSSCAGWIMMSKETALKERIGCCNESNWREKAISNMQAEVELYDQYLTGDVYSYTLMEETSPDEWTEVDSCWGFYGADVLTNGIADNVPGLAEAVASGQYEEGKAERHTVVTYSY